MNKLLHHYYNRFTAPWIVSGTTRVSQYQKCKTNLDLLEQEIVAVASAGPYANLHLIPDRITMPASHHSSFYRPDALPAIQPRSSKH